jgi:hypothetical protein
VIGPALAELPDYLAALLPKVDPESLTDDSPRRGVLSCFLFGAIHASAVAHKITPPSASANALCMFSRLLPKASEGTVEEIVRWAAQSTARASNWNPITHEASMSSSAAVQTRPAMPSTESMRRSPRRRRRSEEAWEVFLGFCRVLSVGD